ncbi:MAG: hypothetical protein SOR67_06820, partial [Alloprevotella sp.]|nr:hypothetical protein [Alloprevotella sp.]
ALPDHVCIRPSLCSKRVPRFKQKRPACGGFQYSKRGGWWLARRGCAKMHILSSPSKVRQNG